MKTKNLQCFLCVCVLGTDGGRGCSFRDYCYEGEVFRTACCDRHGLYIHTLSGVAHVMRATWGWGQHPPGIRRPPSVHVRRCLAQVLATGFHRFLARFSGRRRPQGPFHHKSPPWTILALVVVSSLFSIVDACSSRTAPKPRPPAPTPRPNVTFHTFECPPDYATWFCLNGATCFALKIGVSLLYNCECSEGYMGPRCEYKDLDGSYLRNQKSMMLQTASIAGGAMVAVFVVMVLCGMAYLHYKNRTKGASGMGTDTVDGSASSGRRRLTHPTFGTRWRTNNNHNLDLPIAAVYERTTSPPDERNRIELHQVTTLTTATTPPSPNGP